MPFGLLAWCALQAGGAAQDLRGPVLYVRGETGFEIASGLYGGAKVAIPMHSRCERDPHAVETKGEILLRVYTGSKGISNVERVTLGAVPHSSEQFVSTWLGLVTPTALPVSVTRISDGADVLPQLARRDQVAVGDDLRVKIAPEHVDDRLLLLTDEAPTYLYDGENLAGPYFETALNGTVCEQKSLEQWWRAELAWWVNKKPATEVEVSLRNGLQADAIWLGKTGKLPAAVPLPLRGVRSLPTVLGPRVQRRGVGPEWPGVTAAMTSEGCAPDSDLLRHLASTEDERIDLPADRLIELRFAAPAQLEAGDTWTLMFELTAGDMLPREPCQPSGVTPRAGLFRDVSREAHVDLVHMEGPDLQLDIRPTMGPGAAWGDIDGDGWVDLFLVQGGGREGSAMPTSKMYRNKGNGTFEDVTAHAQLGMKGAGMGALFLDIDGDGDSDLFVCNRGTNRLMLNDGKGVFSDATALLPTNDARWWAAVSAADYDGDGDLDLYVTAYLHYDEKLMPPAADLDRYQREDPIAMLPFAFPGEKKLLLENLTVQRDALGAPAARGPLAFRDRTAELELGDETGRGMQALWWDFDRDGDLDLYLANDVSPNRFWRNEANGTFKDVSLGTGLDDPRGSMGLSAGDIDGDDDEDLFVTNWQLESNALYLNNLHNQSAKSRVGTFRDVAVQAGLAQLSVGVTSWGCELADFDLDGDLDLFYANGYTSPDYESTGLCVGQPCHYFENDGNGKFTAAFEKAGPDVAIPLASRCTLACDYDQDGDLDLVVTANNGRVRLLRNELARGMNHWIGVRLHGQGANTFAIGAQVTIQIGERMLRRTLRAGTSYLGGNAPELHFGLGDATRIDKLRVLWPDGGITEHMIAPIDRCCVLSQDSDKRPQGGR